MKETPFAPEPEAKRRTTMKSWPAPIVPDTDAKKRITMKSSFHTCAVNTKASDSGRYSIDITSELRMNIDHDNEASTDMRAASSKRIMDMSVKGDMIV